MKLIIIIFSAFAMAFFCDKYITGWYNIIPWALLALTLGWYCLTKRQVIIFGSLWGWFLFFSYILLGYSGKTDKASITRFIIFAIAFSLMGALAGMAGFFPGYQLKKRVRGKSENS